MKLQTSLLVIFFSVICSFQLANAQYGYGRYGGWGPFQSHEGFYLSAALGVGGLNYTDDKQDLTLSGATGDFDFKLGGAIAKNLILTADFINVDTRNPDVVIGGVDQGRDDDYLSMNIIGLGVTYYIMPVNIFLSGTLGTGVFDLDGSQTDNGLAVRLQAGKEWWVSRNWGLGLALAYTAMGARWSSTEKADASSLGLMFTTSFN